MPWSLKANALIRGQYARTGAAARIGLAAAQDAVRRAALRGAPAEAVADDLAGKVVMAESFAAVVRSYAWPVAGLDELKIAPFHLLASEGEGPHRPAAFLAPGAAGTAGGMRSAVQGHRHAHGRSGQRAERRQRSHGGSELTAHGAEGMVVKPADFLALGRRAWCSRP